MSWFAVGAAAIGAAGSIGGSLLSRGGGGGGGGGGIDPKVAKEMLDQYVKDVKGEEALMWERNAASNTGYASNINALTDDFRNYIDAYRRTYEAQIAGDNTQLASESNAALAELEGRSRPEIDQAESRSLTLGDRFLQAAEQAQRNYQDSVARISEQALSGTPSVDAAAEAQRSVAFNMQNLGNFAQIADQISQSAVETRARMLASADPRGVELSQIADENAAALMSGRIASDVQANLARSGAMRALQGGFGADSGMGRNLAARDLGLTSLDLMRQGTGMYDAQRRLNFDTRVDGLQTNAADILTNNGLSSQQALNTATDNAARQQQSNLAAAELGLTGAGRLMDSRVGSAESFRNFGGEAIRNAATQRLGLFGNLFTGRMNTAQNLYNTNVATRNNVFGVNVGAAEKVYDRASLMNQDVYKTMNDSTNNVYNTMAGVYGSVLQGQGNVMQQNMLNQQQQTASRNAMTSSIIDSGASILGGVLGNYGGGGGSGMSRSQMSSATISGTTGSYQSWAGGYVPKATGVK
jgi:hypothetical protein